MASGENDMPDRNQLPHLLKLIDDESTTIRSAVCRELYAFGRNLETEIELLDPELTDSQQQALNNIVRTHRGQQLVKNWSQRFENAGTIQQIEHAYVLLSEYFCDSPDQPPLCGQLDELASRYQDGRQFATVFELSRFLFEDNGFSGASEDYYAPHNSDLSRVIQTRRGLPISLTTLFMLVGDRLGLAIGGCNFPGHFLARTTVDRKTYIVDCFNGGRFIEQDDFIAAQKNQSPEFHNAISTDADGIAITARIVRNLVHACQRARDTSCLAAMIDILYQTEHAQKRQHYRIETGLEAPIDTPAFPPGTVICHRHYGYRGVVVDYDVSCRASETWYRSNRTQPNPHQPWYHVLVDHREQTTYAAQSNLVRDDVEREVTHPLLSVFFNQFLDGRYIRNGQPWPQWRHC